MTLATYQELIFFKYISGKHILSVQTAHDPPTLIVFLFLLRLAKIFMTFSLCHLISIENCSACQGLMQLYRLPIVPLHTGRLDQNKLWFDVVFIF